MVLAAIPIGLGLLYGTVRLTDMLLDNASQWFAIKRETLKGKLRSTRTGSRDRALDARHDQEIDEINRQFDEGEVELEDVMKLARQHAKEELVLETKIESRGRTQIALIVSIALVLCVWIVMYLSPYPTCVRHMLLSGADPGESSLYCARHLTR